jgi:hypothetical protein
MHQPEYCQELMQPPPLSAEFQFTKTELVAWHMKAALEVFLNTAWDHRGTQPRNQHISTNEFHANSLFNGSTQETVPYRSRDNQSLKHSLIQITEKIKVKYTYVFVKLKPLVNINITTRCRIKTVEARFHHRNHL